MLLLQYPHFAPNLLTDGSKIQQQPHIDTGGGKVVDSLRFVCGHDRGHRLDLHENLVFHQQIGDEVADHDSLLLHGEAAVCLY